MYWIKFLGLALGSFFIVATLGWITKNNWVLVAIGILGICLTALGFVKKYKLDKMYDDQFTKGLITSDQHSSEWIDKDDLGPKSLWIVGVFLSGSSIIFFCLNLLL